VKVAHSTRLLHAVLALVLAFAFAASAVTPAAAHSPGTGKWYWPVGTERFSMSGWWDFRGYCWHMAQDMGVPAGHSVYAIADGEVLESKYVSGYGPGGGQGGAVVILHKTYRGAEFKALYGHVSKLRYKKGDRVKAGAVIAVINGSHPNHLHFGIHPGRAYPSDNNPFRGHTYTSKRTYGWVDPVKYLRSNYRVDPYVAPPVPIAGSVDTTRAPSWARANGGRLFWSEETAPSEATTWTCALPSGAHRATDTSETVPSHDAKRYVLALAKTGATGITVRDRLPRLTIFSDHAEPEAGHAVVLSGSVRNSAGKPFQHARVNVERWNGSTWVRVACAVTSDSGVWSAKYCPPAGRSAVRARFVPPRTYSPAASKSLRITPEQE